MTTTIATTTFSTYTTTVVAVTTPWPYTKGCETQFVVFIDPDSVTTQVTAWDPSLMSLWNSDALPRWYPQTQCLPKILTSTLENNIQVGSLVCPQSWSQAPYSSPYTGVGSYITCCPPSYTLVATSTIGPSLILSGCTSAVTAGQTIVGPDYLEDSLLVHENITTTQGYPMHTVTFTSATFVAGFMLTASWYDTLSHTQPAVTNYPGQTTYGDDNGDYNYGTYLAVRLGVGITIPLVFLIISIIVFCVVYRRRKRRLQNYYQGSQGPQGPQGGQQTSYVPNQYGQPPNQYGPPPNQYVQPQDQQGQPPNQQVQAPNNGVPNHYFPGGPSQHIQQNYANQPQLPNSQQPGLRSLPDDD